MGHSPDPPPHRRASNQAGAALPSARLRRPGPRAQLLILALPAAASAKRQFTTSSRRSRAGPGRPPALLCSYKNHLKGHFVSRSAGLPRGGGKQRKPRAHKPWRLETPEPLLPAPRLRERLRELRASAPWLESSTERPANPRQSDPHPSPHSHADRSSSAIINKKLN